MATIQTTKHSISLARQARSNYLSLFPKPVGYVGPSWFCVGYVGPSWFHVGYVGPSWFHVGLLDHHDFMLYMFHQQGYHVGDISDGHVGGCFQHGQHDGNVLSIIGKWGGSLGPTQ